MYGRGFRWLVTVCLMDEGRSARLGPSSDTAVGRLGDESNRARKADSPAEAGGRSESLTDDSPGYALSGTARGSITVAAWTMISRITGLLRVVVIGAVLGPTFFANAFLSANSVPNLTYTALAGPVLALVLVPALVHSLAERGMAASGQLLSRVTGYLLFWASVTAGAVVLASPLVALAVTAGIPDDATRWRAWQLTIVLVVFVAPQVICYTLAAVGAAVQQARGRFALASAAPALENLGLIATVVVFALWHGTGVEVLDASGGMLLVLGVGSTLSVAVHAAAQLIGAYRLGLPVRVRGGWRTDPDAREVTHRLRRSLIVTAFPAFSMFVMLAVAATVPGGVFVFQAALSMYFLIAAIGARAVTVATLPGMSAAAKDGDAGRFGAAWRQALTYSVIASLPGLCLLLAFAEPVASVLTNGELHEPTIIRWLTACLAVFAVAQLAHAVYEVSRQALFARLDTSGPRRTSTVVMATRTVVALGVLLVPADGYRLVGLCGAVLLADLVASLMTLFMIRTAIRPQRLLDPRRLTIVGAATVAMLPASAFGSWMVQYQVHDRLPQLAVGFVMGVVALACFGLVLALLTGQLPTVLAKVRARLRA